MNKNEVSESSIGGNFTGRDDNSITINNNTIPISAHSQYLADLYNKFQEEKKENPEFKEMCDELNYYTSRLKGDVLGLEEKLKKGNLTDKLSFAVRCKDRYHRKLMKMTQFSQISQDINIYILAKIELLFMSEIYDLVCKGIKEEDILSIIREKIVTPVTKELGKNALGYNEIHIMGMLYFLTGNCHIKWSK